MNKIWLIDTSVFLEILDIPHKANAPIEIKEEMTQKVNNNDEFYLPLATIFETGRHIPQLSDGNIARDKALKFVKYVEMACKGDAPFKIVEFISHKEILLWLNEFPNYAMRGISLGDFSIIKDLEKIKTKNQNSRVNIWTLDNHLKGYGK